MIPILAVLMLLIIGMTVSWPLAAGICIGIVTTAVFGIFAIF